MLMSLETRIGYHFKNPDLLKVALTHRSLARESGSSRHNQRMEFLGDAVLGLLVAEMLYTLFPDEDEGGLSKRLVALVNGEQLAEIAKDWQLGEALLMSDGEAEQGGRSNKSNLEDGCEALLGAIYLDGGLDAARSLIQSFWAPYAEQSATPPKDAKTTLQEWAQGRGLPLPEYVVISADGPAHAPQFVVEVRVQGKTPARAQAGVKKLAERLAAEAMLATLA
jgi:ribonuclease-3